MKLFSVILTFLVFPVFIISCSNAKSNANERDIIYYYEDTVIIDNDTLIYSRTNLVDTIAIDSIL